MTAAVLALPATAPFDFDASVAFVCGFAPTRGEQEAGDGKLVVAMRAAGSTVLVDRDAAADAPGVQVSLRADGPLGAEVSSAAAARIAFWLSLDDDLAPFYEIARAGLGVPSRPRAPPRLPPGEVRVPVGERRLGDPGAAHPDASGAARQACAGRARRQRHRGGRPDLVGVPGRRAGRRARPRPPGGGRRQRAQGGLSCTSPRSGGRRSTSSCCAPLRTTRSASCCSGSRASGRGRRRS